MPREEFAVMQYRLVEVGWVLEYQAVRKAPEGWQVTREALTVWTI
jgi:hypothetical protein